VGRSVFRRRSNANRRRDGIASRAGQDAKHDFAAAWDRMFDHLANRFAKRRPLTFRQSRQHAQQPRSLDRGPNVAFGLQCEFRNLKMHGFKPKPPVLTPQFGGPRALTAGRGADRGRGVSGKARSGSSRNRPP